jgi:hypothetical protein
METLQVLFWTMVALTLYFLPALVARERKHKNYTPILLVNLLLGWTGLFWIGALVWSTTDNTKS